MRAAARRRARGAAAGLTLDQVWLFAGVAFFALRALLTPIMPHDFWWHLATGRAIVATGQIPEADGFSYTRAGEPFYNQSWLAQVGMYGLHELGGPALLLLAQALVVGGAYGLLLLLAIRRSGRARLSVGVLLLGTLPASFDNWLVRPQTYALPLFIASLYVLTAWRDPRGPRAEGGRVRAFWPPLLLLPALGALWVNLHGSFVLGGALIGLTFIGEALRRWLAARAEERSWATRPVGAAEDVLARPPRPVEPPLWQLALAGALTGLAWLINPGGLRVLGYVRDLLGSSQVTQLVTEWAPPTIREPNGAIFYLFVIAGIVILAYARRPPDPVDMLLAGAFLWLALGAGRNNIWFVAVATPLLARQLAAWRPEGAATRPAYQGLPALNAALAGTIGLLLLLALPWVKPWLGLPPELGAVVHPTTPVAAVERLRAAPDRPERLFHEMSYGSYLIWAAPEQKVWADPRIELYPLEQWREYQRLGSALDVEPLLAQYRVDGLLLSNANQAGLVEWARARPAEWELRYGDEQASYFVRR
ncbi:MAG TPA: hypothetical protein PKD53_05560 [Chloroflexaceae bacterium]|nr:hypothetical protein [Chloroflexaceae bacterium]